MVAARDGVVMATGLGGDTTTVDELLEIIERARPAWTTDGACREHPELSWFPRSWAQAAPAQKVCDGCLVRDECLTAAVDRGEEHGIWGGLTVEERHRLAAGVAIETIRADRAANLMPAGSVPSCAACSMPLSKKRTHCSGCGAPNPHAAGILAAA